MRSSGASAVIHFAGLKAVGESVQNPLIYYDNNVVGNPTQIYRTLSPDGNPALSSFRAILDAMDMRLAVEPKSHSLAPG